jgi:hypothetical protein
MVGDRGRGTGRLSPKCSLYWVRNVLGWLAEQGMARQDPASADGSWALTERFRIQVKDMAAEPAYRFLAALARGQEPGTAVEPGPAVEPGSGVEVGPAVEVGTAVEEGATFR